MTGYISFTNSAFPVARKRSQTQLTKSSAASAVLYIGSFFPSGNRFGMRPFLSYFANVLRIDSASSYCPVEMHTPGRAIIVSRPQSSKNGNPASIVLPPVDSRRDTNWWALFTRNAAVSSQIPAFFTRAFLCSFISRITDSARLPASSCSPIPPFSVLYTIASDALSPLFTSRLI